MSQGSNTHAGAESDGCVLPSKCPNNGGQPLAEGMEGRQPTKENIGQATAPRTQSRISELSDLLGVRKAARKDKRTRFTALLHHVTVNLLRDSYYALKREAAPGVDGVRWQEYETNLDEKLADLHSRIHRGTYRAQPSKRAYIQKEDGRQRPLGIAALEDKIIQQAVVTVLNQIYEEDFLGFSYGFQPGRSQHIVVGFESRADAERFLQEWKERLQKFGLELHPDKTRLIEFGREATENRKQRGESKPEVFNFLGFTHMCGKTRKTGRFIVKRQTIRKRLSAKLSELKEELRRRWHQPVAEVGKWLRSVVQGYFNYHAVPGNMDSLNSFRAQVIWRWYRALRRRSQRDRMTWERFWPLVDRWIPSARILHPHPNVRFDAKYLR